MLALLLEIADERDYDKVMYLYTTYYNRMLGYAITILRGESNTLYDAENAVEEAFLNIITHIDTIDFSRSEEEIGSYLLKTVKNEALYIKRLHRRHGEKIASDLEEIDAEDECFVEKLCIKEDYERVLSAIEMLGEVYKDTLYMKFVLELSPKEISKRMNIPAKTVYTNISRGKDILLKLLNEGGDEI